MINNFRLLIDRIIINDLVRELFLMIYFFICTIIYSLFVLLLKQILFKKKYIYTKILKIIYFIFFIFIIIFCISYPELIESTFIYFITLIFCTTFIYTSYLSKQNYYKNIIKNSFNIYPECKKINTMLDNYISTNKYSDLYKINKIYKALSPYSTKSCIFLTDVLDREINKSTAVRDSFIFLLFGAVIGNRFFYFSNQFTAVEFIFTMLFSIIILSATYLFFYFIIDITFYESLEVKKYNILKKYTDLIK